MVKLLGMWHCSPLIGSSWFLMGVHHFISAFISVEKEKQTQTGDKMSSYGYNYDQIE